VINRPAWTSGAVLAVALVITLSACGAADPVGSPPPPAPAVTAAGDALETSPSGSLPPGSPPPTTTPLAVASLTCTEPVVTIAERVLIERRQRAAPDCLAGALSATVSSADRSEGPVCWDRCADGRSFADFVLDPTAVPDTASATGVLLVPYAARYIDEAGVESTEAESLRFERVGDGWVATGVTSTDLGPQRAVALATIERYLAALAGGDYPVAAGLLLGAAGVVTADRDDLGRLIDEGMLVAGTGAGDVARALEAWCRSGAACSTPASLRTEVTPRHTLRVVATYLLDGLDYEVVYTVTGDGGVDEVFGLPPRP